MDPIEQLKTYFRDADPEAIQEIANLERKVKTAKLYANLADHDAIKFILEFANSFIKSQNAFLQNQEVSTEADRLARARKMAHRDVMRWFVTLFTIQKSRQESGENKIAELANSIEE